MTDTIRKILQGLHLIKASDHSEQFDKCRTCEYGVIIKPYRLVRLAGCCPMMKNMKDKSRRCNYKLKRLGRKLLNENI